MDLLLSLQEKNDLAPWGDDSGVRKPSQGIQKRGQASGMADGMEDWVIIIRTGWRREWGMGIWDPPQYGEGKAMVCVAGRKKVAEWSSGRRESVSCRGQESGEILGHGKWHHLVLF